MLVLMIIPLVSAMDSNETFFEEYDVSDCEEVIVEYDNEVEYTQKDVSNEVEVHDDVPDDLESQIKPQKEEIDTVPVIEFREEINSIDVEYNEEIQIIEENKIEYTSEVVDIDEINGTTSEKITLDKIQGMELIFKNQNNIKNKYLSINIFVESAAFKTTSLKDNIFKVLKLKDQLLTKQDTQTQDSHNNINNLDNVLIIGINKVTTDYAYSINNVIVGDDYNKTYESSIMPDLVLTLFFHLNFQILKFVYLILFFYKT